MRRSVNPGLYAPNHPAGFWRLLRKPEPSSDEWERATRAAAAVLPAEVAGDGPCLGELLARTLGEGQFGPDHWRPRRRRRRAGQRAFRLGWPIEERYARFLWETAGSLMASAGDRELPFIFFWPHGHRLALVLTHDVETAAAQAWAPLVADLEERLGFRSSFNFAAGRCPVDAGLVRDLRDRGFEVGACGPADGGRRSGSRAELERLAERTNVFLGALGAVGVRSPLGRRHPDWMQALQVEYDSSLFDSNPFQPVPGGAMSPWPFLIGRLVELPSTLPPGSIPGEALGEHSPGTWLRKTEFIARCHGMALLNTRPDHLREPARRRPYQAYLETMRDRGEHWQALPREVARWWRRRLLARRLPDLPGAAEGRLRLGEGPRLEVVPPPVAPVCSPARRDPG